uniref:Uncharacterized protein n=1 Tax=Chromera velia CCMP2878 TaxID=1169474 RepID=A0A0G4HVJ1_9ALVE|eukprot:Cvel_32294.t1-p1 / transcript=Cvel_32294.t1 / gene=Cvel_32294 / organism=Chromera_velia_CCMP2878 / gene_product=hypothetical protein / transcript_product=hypothetical protein / location=Cvel_scaffold4995:4704-5843(-) / protein_length=380 / sequence_SO=supercontig / SO=protein_coding / is_pseudo=false
MVQIVRGKRGKGKETARRNQGIWKCSVCFALMPNDRTVIRKHWKLTKYPLHRSDLKPVGSVVANGRLEVAGQPLPPFQPEPVDEGAHDPADESNSDSEEFEAVLAAAAAAVQGRRGRRVSVSLESVFEAFGGVEEGEGGQIVDTDLYLEEATIANATELLLFRAISKTNSNNRKAAVWLETLKHPMFDKNQLPQGESKSAVQRLRERSMRQYNFYEKKEYVPTLPMFGCTTLSRSEIRDSESPDASPATFAFFWRDPVEAMKVLLRQIAIAGHPLHFAPTTSSAIRENAGSARQPVRQRRVGPHFSSAVFFKDVYKALITDQNLDTGEHGIVGFGFSADTTATAIMPIYLFTTSSTRKSIESSLGKVLIGLLQKWKLFSK